MSKCIDIVFPNAMREASESALTLCEVFIGCLLSENKGHILLKVNNNEGFVEANDAKIKEVLTLFLKTSKLEGFYRQFKDLLHIENLSQGSIGELKLVKDGESLSIQILEKKSFPDFEWDLVVKSSS